MAVSGLHGMICAFGREIQRADWLCKGYQQMTRIQICNETLLFVQDMNKYLKIN